MYVRILCAVELGKYGYNNICKEKLFETFNVWKFTVYCIVNLQKCIHLCKDLSINTHPDNVRLILLLLYKKYTLHFWGTFQEADFHRSCLFVIIYFKFFSSEYKDYISSTEFLFFNLLFSFFVDERHDAKRCNMFVKFTDIKKINSQEMVSQIILGKKEY